MAQTESVAQLEKLMHDYIDLFSAGDFETAVSSYQMPFTWFVGESVATAFTPEEWIERMNAMRNPLLDKDFKRSELRLCSVHMLGENCALVGVEVARIYGSADPEITGGTYTAHKDATGWKLASILSHPVDEIIGRN